MARAAGQISYDVLKLTVERLRIRFSPILVPTEGLTLRQFRTEAALEMLREIKVAELPEGVVEHFLRFRSGVQALNLAMNSEKPDAEVALGQYKVVFEWTVGPYGAFQALLSKLYKFPERKIDWRPPKDFEKLVWNDLKKDRRVSSDVRDEAPKSAT